MPHKVAVSTWKYRFYYLLKNSITQTSHNIVNKSTKIIMAFLWLPSENGEKKQELRAKTLLPGRILHHSQTSHIDRDCILLPPRHVDSPLTLLELTHISVKVQIFWEGCKNLKESSTFLWHYKVTSKKVEAYFKFSWHSQNI